jgi:hypothetical protein
MKRILIAAGVACTTPVFVGAQQTVPATSDTVLRFDVAARTWTWPYLLAHVGLSCQGAQVTVGTTTAPDTTSRDRDHYCVGAVIEMRNSTLTLRGARGVVHVRLNRTLMDSTRQPRR